MSTNIRATESTNGLNKGGLDSVQPATKTPKAVNESPNFSQNPSNMADRRKKIYNFAETPEAILAKYSQEPPSLELHIHHHHYRFGNQEGIIPRNSEMIKIFIQYIQQGQIPPSATEVFRDAGIRFYEGCIIIKITDHRNAVMTEKDEDSAENQGTAKETVDDEVSSKAPLDDPDTTAAQQRSYISLLRPTSLSLYHDLMYTSDPSHGRFTDQLAVNMESEILSLTVRNIDLTVKEKPVDLSPIIYTKVAEQTTTIPRPSYKTIKEAVSHLHHHRPLGKKAVRPLHSDLTHPSSSSFETMMLIMDESERGERSKMANSGGANSSNSSQFMRLSFIEQWRKKRDRMRATQKAQAQLQRSQKGQGQSQSGLPGQQPVQKSGIPGQPVQGQGQNPRQLQQQQQLQQLQQHHPGQPSQQQQLQQQQQQSQYQQQQQHQQYQQSQQPTQSYQQVRNNTSVPQPNSAGMPNMTGQNSYQQHLQRSNAMLQQKQQQLPLGQQQPSPSQQQSQLGNIQRNPITGLPKITQAQFAQLTPQQQQMIRMQHQQQMQLYQAKKMAAANNNNNNNSNSNPNNLNFNSPNMGNTINSPGSPNNGIYQGQQMQAASPSSRQSTPGINPTNSAGKRRKASKTVPGARKIGGKTLPGGSPQNSGGVGPSPSKKAKKG
ncbi:hypothetical protein NADFUDRAFT_68093 [Nadsonia fulvescens var. elongata DSM 6958]|uniref:Spt20-like SEP domain-containing protein n=1 Tax=Nadsonia fulvescens var. elongata DSM 6958 TaxID=857566 RepID=A0A1E3PCK4_9ASCO|nr:hypothetical protein NADFUDRAFT_68093 [Nadsonia fulvescens var. elongata DSM 6958]